MKPAAFDYFCPDTLAECLALLARFGADARLLAGGQSLMPLVNRREARPRIVIDINRIPGLDQIEERADVIHIGANTRYRALEDWGPLAGAAPLLVQALPWIGNPAVRNRGTVGGSLAFADPAAELPACAICLDGKASISSHRGSRVVPIRALIGSDKSLGLEADEMITGLSIPVASVGERYLFNEIGRRGRDVAIAGVALHMRGHSAADTSLVVFGAVRAATLVRGLPPDLGRGSEKAEIERLLQMLHGQLEPLGDFAYPGEVRLRMAATLIHRTYVQLRV